MTVSRPRTWSVGPRSELSEAVYQLRVRGFKKEELRRFLGWGRLLISRFQGPGSGLFPLRRLQVVLLFEQTHDCLRQRRRSKAAAKTRYESQLRDREVTVWKRRGRPRKFVTCKVPPLASRGKIALLRGLQYPREAKSRSPVLLQVSRRMGFRKRLRRWSRHGVDLSWARWVKKVNRVLRDEPATVVQPRLDGKYLGIAGSLPGWIGRADE